MQPRITGKAMKKYLSVFVIGLSTVILLSCAPSLQFEDKVATQVSLSFTATALDEMLKQPTDTPSPDATETPEPTATQPLPEGNPKNTLGSPTWGDDLANGKNWNLESSDITFGGTTFSVKDGKLVATSATTSEGYVWWLNFRKLKNAYLEAKFEVGTCSGNDQYGLVFRSVNYDDGYAYYYTVSCEGKYDLRRRTTTGSVMLLGFPQSGFINDGSDQTNTLGIWMQNDRISLYVNGELLEEITDKELGEEGHFGIFINAAKTPGFTVRMDEISYWLLD
jgi:hypothetical protein